MKEKIEKASKDAKEFGRKAWEQAKNVGSNGIRFAKENKELVAMGIPLAIASVKAGQSLVVNRRIKNERRWKDRHIYDPSLGDSWELRRKLSNAERAEINRRRKDGQEMYDILSSLHLLKR